MWNTIWQITCKNSLKHELITWYHVAIQLKYLALLATAPDATRPSHEPATKDKQCFQHTWPLLQQTGQPCPTSTHHDLHQHPSSLDTSSSPWTLVWLSLQLATFNNDSSFQVTANHPIKVTHEASSKSWSFITMSIHTSATHIHHYQHHHAKQHLLIEVNIYYILFCIFLFKL